MLEEDTSTAVVSKQLCASKTSVFVDLHFPAMDLTCSDPICALAHYPSVVSTLESVPSLAIPAQVAELPAKPHS